MGKLLATMDCFINGSLVPKGSVIDEEGIVLKAGDTHLVPANPKVLGEVLADGGPAIDTSLLDDGNDDPKINADFGGNKDSLLAIAAAEGVELDPDDTKAIIISKITAKRQG